MGRRPNLLIRENFVRGPKLENSSNRYHHTCKNCGERFPKGRIDTLTNHLAKQCRALTADERVRILGRIGRIPEGMQPDSGTSSLHQSSQEEEVRVSFEPAPTFDGLNVLAEASRQVGATEQRKGKVPTARGQEPFIMNTAPDASVNDVFSNSPLVPFQQLQTPSQIHQPPSPSGALSATFVAADGVHISAHSSTELQSIAVSADDMISHEILHTSEDMVRMLEQQVNTNCGEHSSGDNIVAEQVSDPVSRAVVHPRRIVARPNDDCHTAALGSSEDKSSKNRGRARFTANRRKEVSDLRRMGACLRCRVLRKPCSANDPCKSCSAIGNSRTWTWPCSRARIAHEIQLYSSGLHCNLAYTELGSVTSRLKFRSISCHLEAFHSYKGTHREMFKAVKLSTGQSLEMSSAFAEANDPYLIFIDKETEDMNEKMRNYVKQSIIDVYEEEPSSPVKVTIEMALSNIVSGDKDTLLSSVVELWTATNLLVRKREDWDIELNGTLTPTESISIKSGPVNSTSHDLITTQLLSAIEKTAEKLCHDAVSQLEQRFMRKLHDGAFGTFLASIIVLSCVERMSWLYLAWHMPDSNEGPGPWPLDNPPVHYVESGERFCDVLLLLLRVRELVPPTGLHRYAQEVIQTISPVDDGIKRWIGNIQITQEHLEQRLHARFDPEDYRSMDMKLISRLLHVIVLPPLNSDSKTETSVEN